MAGSDKDNFSSSPKAKKNAGSKVRKKTATRNSGSIIDNTPELQRAIRELIRLAKDQEFLSIEDINQALPGEFSGIEVIEELMERLRAMEFRIVESDSEVENIKSQKAEEEEEANEAEKEAKSKSSGRLEGLDDPVRLYLKQMGQVPLLTREEEVGISKRIEKADKHVQKLLTRFGFMTDCYLEMADRIESGSERFDRMISEKKVTNRERYFKALGQLREKVEDAHQTSAGLYLKHRSNGNESSGEWGKEWEQAMAVLTKLFDRFHLQTESNRGVC